MLKRNMKSEKYRMTQSVEIKKNWETVISLESMSFKNIKC